MLCTFLHKRSTNFSNAEKLKNVWWGAEEMTLFKIHRCCRYFKNIDISILTSMYRLTLLRPHSRIQTWRILSRMLIFPLLIIFWDCFQVWPCGAFGGSVQTWNLRATDGLLFFFKLTTRRGGVLFSPQNEVAASLVRILQNRSLFREFTYQKSVLTAASKRPAVRGIVNYDSKFENTVNTSSKKYKWPRYLRVRWLTQL